MRYVDENGNEISELDMDLSKGYLINTHIVKTDAPPIDNITKFAWDVDDLEPVKMYFQYDQNHLDRVAYYDAMSKLSGSDHIFYKLMEDLVTECHGITDLISIFTRYSKEYGDTIKSRKEWRKIVQELKPKVESEEKE